MEGIENKKRKSRFDIAPEEVCFIGLGYKAPTPKSQEDTNLLSETTTDELNQIEQNNEIFVSSKRKSRFDTKSNDLNSSVSTESTSEVTLNSIFNSQDSFPINFSSGYYYPLESNEIFLPYQTINDLFFVEKLKKAVERNYNFIRRKDQLAEEAHSKMIEYHQSILQNQAKNILPKTNQEKLGIGMASSKISQPKIESSSIYVSNLPTDFLEEELEILFSSQGKIKKIKLYKDSNGINKGDALITFFSVDAAALSCIKFNKLNIGDGHIILVEKAKFESNKQDQPLSTEDSSNIPVENCENLNHLCDNFDAIKKNEILQPSDLNPLPTSDQEYVVTEDIQKDVENIEDFLNSLL